MSKTILKKLPDGNFVNPAHVTCIEVKRHEASKSATTKVWVRKDSGYGTGSFDFTGDRADELAAILHA